MLQILILRYLSKSYTGMIRWSGYFIFFQPTLNMLSDLQKKLHIFPCSAHTRGAHRDARAARLRRLARAPCPCLRPPPPPPQPPPQIPLRRLPAVIQKIKHSLSHRIHLIYRFP